MKVGFKMDSDMVTGVQDWPLPQSTFDVRLFIEFVNFYRCLIPNFFGVIHPLTVFTGKVVKFKWSEECQRAFETLWEAFVKAHILAYIYWTREVVVEILASDYVSAGVLS